MPHHPPCPSEPTDLQPVSAEPAALRALLAATAADPWRASLFMRRLTTLRERLGELRVWLESLSRRMRRAWARRWALALPAAALVMALASSTAMAKLDATITVGTGGCTLSAAITNANNNNQSGSASCTAGSGADTIDFANANGTYGYTTALPDITTPITIQGNGNTTIQRTGGPAFSVLRVTLGGDLTLTSATITGGSASAGGGIYVRESTVSVIDSTINGNSASYYGGGLRAYDSKVNLQGATISGNRTAGKGGGIYADNDSTVSLTAGSSISGNSANVNGGGIHALNCTIDLQNATISNNSAGIQGGGIAVRYTSLVLADTTVSGNATQGDGGGIRVGNGTLAMFNSTISGNSAADDGGGIYFRHFTLITTNSTISGNSAGGDGGGIFEYESVATLTHLTVTGNSAGNLGGGVRVLNSSMYISNSIVAGQAAGPDCSTVGATISNGYNIESATSCGFTATGDQQMVSAAQLNLGALALNPPGTTQTRALGAGSAALDQIPLFTSGCGIAFIFDQRGVTRPQFGACDVGAYELDVVLPIPTPAPPTAAQVTHFAAATDPTGRIRITWETASEVDVTGFRVERASTAGGPWRAVGGLIPARGDAAGGAAYAVTDAPGVGSFSYRLEVVDTDSVPQTYGPVEAMVRTLRAFLPVGWR